MKINAGVLEKCPTDAVIAEIPDNVKFIADNAFAGCTELKQIISKSPLFISKSGCLYDAKNKMLITTVCGSVVIPREVRGALEGSLTNCTAVSFESGGEFVDIKCNPQDTGGSEKIIELISKEADKNYAKLIKQAKMNEISAAAVLKQIIAKSGMDIQQYRVGDCISALSLPADIGGVDIMLADEDFQKKKKGLQLPSWSHTAESITSFCLHTIPSGMPFLMKRQAVIWEWALKPLSPCGFPKGLNKSEAACLLRVNRLNICFLKERSHNMNSGKILLPISSDHRLFGLLSVLMVILKSHNS